MSDMAVFTGVAVAGSVVIVASGLGAFVAACRDGPGGVRRVSGLSRAESKEADLEHAEVRASGARGVSWWGMRGSKRLSGDAGSVGAREHGQEPPIEKREAKSVGREPTSVRNFKQPVEAERIDVKPAYREPPVARSSSRASTVSLPSNPSPEPFPRDGGSAGSSSASSAEPSVVRRASHLTSATAVPLTPAAQRPPQLSDTLTTQRQFLVAASKLSDEELRDFVADFISAEIAAINKLPPELRGPAYRSLCIAWHPDKCPAIASIATSVFQLLQAQKNKIR